MLISLKNTNIRIISGTTMHLWFDHSPNAERLEVLRQMIDNEDALKQKFEEYYGM